MLPDGVMDYEFIVEDDETTTAPHLSGWETVVFQLGDAPDERIAKGNDEADGDVGEGLEELIVALYF